LHLRGCLIEPASTNNPKDHRMKIAIFVSPDGSRVSGHAGRARHWRVFHCMPGQPLPEGVPVVLTQAQLPHDFADDDPHPLHGVEVMIAASAGVGFVRHTAKCGAKVLLTDQAHPRDALAKVLAGEALPDTRFDITTTLCKLRDLFSRH
jgi:predicted Fe-Mo cluster-binding NifX family protein